eukprot:sb/3463808/
MNHIHRTDHPIVAQVAMARRKVGYWMREGKAKRINIKLIQQILSEKHHCDLVELDPDNLVEVEVVFHKLTDLIFDAKQGKLESIQHVKKIECYILLGRIGVEGNVLIKLRMSGRIEIFDPLPNIQVIVDRKTMMEAIQKCSNMCDLDKKFYSSGYLYVEDVSTLSTQLSDRGYTYPMMCKSRIAQGAQGHDMSLILNERGLSTVIESNVIVPFIPHNAVLYKVFVCGDRHKTLVRPSITVERLAGQDSYNFHSDTVSKNVKSAPSQVQQVNKKFYSSGYLYVEDVSTLSTQLSDRGYTYPMMCKSRIAQGAQLSGQCSDHSSRLFCSSRVEQVKRQVLARSACRSFERSENSDKTPSSQGHDMSLILNERGLSTVIESNVIVPFIPHNAVLYKVFVCGERHKTLVRPSITVERLAGQDSYNFHSDTVSKNVKSAPSQVQQDLCCMETMNKVSDVSNELLDHVSHWCEVLTKGLGLSLFGYDVLVEEGSGKAYIVDINYMPGYAGFEDFHEVLCAMLARSAQSIRDT